MCASQALPILEQNKQLLARWFEEVWNQNRRETIAELLAPDSVIYDGTAAIRGPKEFEQFHDRLRAQFSDFRITPLVTLAEGDLACVHWNATFRHTASEKSMHITGTSVARIKDGKVIEAWQNWDAAGLAAQMAG